MTTTLTQPTAAALRTQAIASLIQIRDSAALDLAVMPGAKQASEWAADRYRDIEWANRQLARMGVLDTLMADDTTFGGETTMAIRVKDSNGTYATLDAGFYGTDHETYYVTPAGRVWIVASEDDLGTGDDPKEILPSDLPAAETLKAIGDIVAPDGAIDHCRRIEAASGEKLIRCDD